MSPEGDLYIQPTIIFLLLEFISIAHISNSLSRQKLDRSIVVDWMLCLVIMHTPPFGTPSLQELDAIL